MANRELQRSLPWITWSKLRSLGNSHSVRLSALFPFVGFWILFNDQAHQFLKLSVLDGDLAAQGCIAAIWRNKLFFVYFGLLLMGIGSFIYQARCPYVVRKHADWSDYVIADGDAMTKMQIVDLGKAMAINMNHAGSSMEQARSFLMQNWYASESATKPISRLMTAFCFFAGLGMLAVPSLVSAIKIAALAVGKL